MNSVDRGKQDTLGGGEHGALPLVSVIIAMRNEEAFIGKCLTSVAEQDYPAELLEVLVIDGRSTDRSREVVSAMTALLLNLRLLDNQKRVAPVAFNIGINNAHGQVLTIISAHCYLASDYISRCVEYLAKTGAECVGGPIRSIGETRTAKAIALGMSSPFGVGDAHFRYSQKEHYVDTLAFGAYRRGVFDQVGLFDEELVGNEDDEFNYRLRRDGGKLFLTPAIKSFYYSRASLRALWKQYFQYGFGKVRVVQKHPTLVKFRHLIPALFVASLMVTALLGFFSPTFATLFVLIVGSYLLLSFLFSLRIASKRGWQHLPILPLAFACLHVAYGTGFLKGLVYFTLLGKKGDRTG
jgi:glycosyltransferase involved in cell wall biosynthesis